METRRVLRGRDRFAQRIFAVAVRIENFEFAEQRHPEFPQQRVATGYVGDSGYFGQLFVDVAAGNKSID